METLLPIYTPEPPAFKELDINEKRRLSKVSFVEVKKRILPIQNIDRVISVANWESLEHVHTVEGRSFFIPRMPIVEEYDTLQISGVGYRRISHYNPTMGYAFSHREAAVFPPSLDNILNIVRGLHNTIRVLPTGFIESIRPSYRYAGGYTQLEAQEKEDNMMIVQQWENCPFLVPYFEGVGRYPRLRGEMGQMFFIVSSVPFGGLRYGNLVSMAVKERLEMDLVKNMLFDLVYELGRALKFMHDQGYAHLQPHMGNCMFWNGKLFLTDFGTMTELRHYGLKVYDIYIALRSAITTMQFMLGREFQVLEETNLLFGFKIDEELWEIFNRIFSQLVNGYNNENVQLEIHPLRIADIINSEAIEGREPGKAIIVLYNLLSDNISGFSQL